MEGKSVTTIQSSSSFRFLLLGGWTAIKSATVGSICVVLFNLTLLGIHDVWKNGIQILKFSLSGFQSLLSSIALLLLSTILISILPAFIGGLLLFWLLKRKHPNWLIALQSRLRLGILIGALTGVILTSFLLVLADAVGRVAHSGLGYDLNSQIPVYIFYAIEIISIAAIAGRWTDIQLRKQL